MEKKLTFYVNNKMQNVHVEKTKNKNMYLKIKNKKIVVLVPSFVSIESAKKFTEKHIKDFADHLENIKKNDLYSIDKKFIHIFGEKYKIVILSGFKKSNAYIKGKTFYIEENENQNYQKIINSFLKKQALKYIVSKTNEIAKSMKLKKHLIIVNKKNSAWGTNFVGSDKISFSYRLVHFDYWIINYVIIHELSHSIFPNHSKDFWNLVYSLCPQYKEAKIKLKTLEID